MMLLNIRINSLLTTMILICFHTLILLVTQSLEFWCIVEIFWKTLHQLWSMSACQFFIKQFKSILLNINHQIYTFTWDIIIHLAGAEVLMVVLDYLDYHLIKIILEKKMNIHLWLNLFHQETTTIWIKCNAWKQLNRLELMSTNYHLQNMAFLVQFMEAVLFDMQTGYFLDHLFQRCPNLVKLRLNKFTLRHCDPQLVCINHSTWLFHYQSYLDRALSSFTFFRVLENVWLSIGNMLIKTTMYHFN